MNPERPTAYEQLTLEAAAQVVSGEQLRVLGRRTKLPGVVGHAIALPAGPVQRDQLLK